MQKPVTVGTASVKIVDDNKNRRYLLVVNNSTGNVYLKFGGYLASLNDDLPLRGQGAHWESPPGFYLGRAQNDDVLGPVYAIADAAGQSLRVFEV